MYKLSNAAVELISSVIKDSRKKDYKISNKQEMEELCFSLALLCGLSSGKLDKVDQKDKLAETTSLLEEIYTHLEEIDYEDLNRRI